MKQSSRNQFSLTKLAATWAVANAGVWLFTGLFGIAEGWLASTVLFVFVSLAVLAAFVIANESARHILLPQNKYTEHPFFILVMCGILAAQAVFTILFLATSFLDYAFEWELSGYAYFRLAFYVFWLAAVVLCFYGLEEQSLFFTGRLRWGLRSFAYYSSLLFAVQVGSYFLSRDVGLGTHIACAVLAAAASWLVGTTDWREKLPSETPTKTKNKTAGPHARPSTRRVATPHQSEPAPPTVDETTVEATSPSSAASGNQNEVEDGGFDNLFGRE